MRRWSFPISSIVWAFQVPIRVVLLWRFLLFLVFRVIDFRSFSGLEESSTLQFQSPVSESSLPCGFKLTSSCPGVITTWSIPSPGVILTLAVLGVSAASGSFSFLFVFIMCGFVSKVLPGRLPLLSRWLWSPINVSYEALV